MVPKPENKLTAWYVNEPEKVLDVQRIQQIIGEGAEFYETSSYEDAAAMLERIRQRKKIRYEDRLHLSPHKDDYVSMTEMFRREHKHPDQEVRYFERGTGFLDVRDKSDRWLRLQVGAGHLLVLPAQIYHRFSPATQQEEIVVHRLFEDVDTWTADFRDDQGNQ
ncbi:acireductone dioxygenase-like isoform X2 [Dermacentor andersoni]|uniref:acireductone dioxygenase-like isoform X2 n=1 Tax=Dermacentor andersoni TaxID=34620 RepID=UPI0021551E1C|nr:acireductone dioxygenase-like isoform X2 [Dermacentor andersoni]